VLVLVPDGRRFAIATGFGVVRLLCFIATYTSDFAF
jgi:hypothetical protein